MRDKDMEATDRAAPAKAVAIIACAKQKRSMAAPAVELYDRSQLFRLSIAAARREGFAVLVLSSKYGLVKPDAVLQPYEVDLRHMSATERSTWHATVTKQAQALLSGRGIDQVVCFAGQDYRQALKAVCEPMSIRVSTYSGWRRICEKAFGRD